MPHSVPTRPAATRFFAAAAAALGVVLTLGIVAAAGYQSSAAWVDHTLKVQRALDRWELAMVSLQNRARGYFATTDPRFLERWDAEQAEELAAEAALEKLVADNSSQLTRVHGVSGNDALALRRYLGSQLALIGSGNHASALARVADGQRAMDTFRSSIAGLRAQEDQLLQERRLQANERAWQAAFGAGLVAVLAAGFLALAWRRELRHEDRVAEMARAARQRLKVLATLADALSTARSTQQVADVIVEQGLLAAGGDTCVVYRLSDRGDELLLLAHSGGAPEIVDKLRVISAVAGNPETFASMKKGRSVWVESDADYAALYPDLARAKVEGRRPRAFWSVPLVAEGQALGLLGVGFYEPRRFSVDERAFVETLAHQCAQALLRASRTEAEERTRGWFSTTLRSIGDAVIATDRSGNVTFLNPIAERLTGWSNGEALGQPLDVVFHIISEHTRAVVESPVARVLREGKVVGLANHTVLLPKSGAELPIADSGAPIRNEQGEIVGVVLVFRDASEEKRREYRHEFLARAGEALGASLDYQSTLAAVARLAVPQLADWCAVDLVEAGTTRSKQVAVAHVDPAKVRYAEQLGTRYPTPEDAHAGVPEVIRTGKSELYAELSPELLEAGARDAEHLRMIRELELKSAMVVPLRAHGRSFGAMTFVYAGSERRYTPDDLAFAEELARRAAMAIENCIALKDAERARVKERWLREEAERTSRLKDDFLATASHELRTPLNAILGWTLTLIRTAEGESSRALKIIERNARAQAKLIDDVLDVSRIVSGKLALTLTPVSVAAAARAAIETVQPAADAKNIRLVSELSEEPLTVSADADRLQQIIWNLLSNSVKFTPKEGEVRLRVFRDGSDVCVVVKDNGEGIRAGLLTAIFEPFQQADSSTTRRHGGLGLGLSIVKQLVVAHGGSVAASSEGPGHGSTFTVRLPLRAVSAPAPEAKSSPRHSPPTRRLDGLSVLVVDDEPDARMLLEEILCEQGARVRLAESVSQARRELQVEKPDVIVSDIGMPDEDGYAFIRRLRDSGNGTPAIALTAYASHQDAERALGAGFQRHVMKPVEPANLVNVVAALGAKSGRSAAQAH